MRKSPCFFGTFVLETRFLAKLNEWLPKYQNFKVLCVFPIIFTPQTIDFLFWKQNLVFVDNLKWLFAPSVHSLRSYPSSLENL